MQLSDTEKRKILINLDKFSNKLADIKCSSLFFKEEEAYLDICNDLKMDLERLYTLIRGEINVKNSVRRKICILCGKYKRYNEFYTQKNKLDGLTGRCKRCYKIKGKIDEFR